MAAGSLGDASTAAPGHARDAATLDTPGRRDPPQALPQPGERFGRYQIERELARGGMGVVYVARDVEAERDVALKVIAAGSSETAKQRFEVEAEAAARVQHPNVVPVHDYGVDPRGRAWLAMALVEGESLNQRVARDGPLAGPEAARLLIPLCRALAQAHAQDLLHRDLKPGNVLLDAQGTPLLADFGLARLRRDGESLTKTGDVMGTPAYMAPEQADGDKRLLGPATDIYGLGAVLYYLLTGSAPFTGGTVAMLAAILRRPPPPPRALRASVDRRIQAVCLKCLAKPPAARYPNATALAEDLQRYLRGHPLQATRGRRIALGTALIAALSLVGLGTWIAKAERTATAPALEAPREERPRPRPTRTRTPLPIVLELDRAALADVTRLPRLGVTLPGAMRPGPRESLLVAVNGRETAELRQRMRLSSDASVELSCELRLLCLEEHTPVQATSPRGPCVELRLHGMSHVVPDDAAAGERIALGDERWLGVGLLPLPGGRVGLVQVLGRKPRTLDLITEELATLDLDPQATWRMSLELSQSLAGQSRWGVRFERIDVEPPQLVFAKKGTAQIQPRGEYWARCGSHLDSDGHSYPGWPWRGDAFARTRYALGRFSLRASGNSALEESPLPEHASLDGSSAGLPYGLEEVFALGRRMMALHLVPDDARSARARALADEFSHYDRMDFYTARGMNRVAVGTAGVARWWSQYSLALAGQAETARDRLYGMKETLFESEIAVNAYTHWPVHISAESLAGATPEQRQAVSLVLALEPAEAATLLTAVREASVALGSQSPAEREHGQGTLDLLSDWGRLALALDADPDAAPLARGRAWLWAGNEALALERLGPPDSERARLLAGFAHYRLGDWSQALALWRGLEQPPDEPLPYQDLARLRAQLEAWLAR